MLRKLNMVDIIVFVDVCVCLCRCALTMRGVWFSPCMRTILSARELCLRRILCSRTGRWDLLPSMSRTLPTAHYTTARVAAVKHRFSRVISNHNSVFLRNTASSEEALVSCQQAFFIFILAEIILLGRYEFHNVWRIVAQLESYCCDSHVQLWNCSIVHLGVL